MLVLSRRAGETIVVGSGIKVIVLETRKGRTKLGIEADGVKVMRGELVTPRPPRPLESKIRKIA